MVSKFFKLKTDIYINGKRKHVCSFMPERLYYGEWPRIKYTFCRSFDELKKAYIENRLHGISNIKEQAPHSPAGLFFHENTDKLQEITFMEAADFAEYDEVEFPVEVNPEELTFKDDLASLTVPELQEFLRDTINNK